ncbi:MAG: oxidoreductase, partial [Polyangiaceae bacterium]|nr:oxidoreductase [Polyangiaceae bacterium]
MSSGIAWAILLPLSGAIASSFAGPRFWRPIACITSLGTPAATLIVAGSVATRGPLRHSVGGWAAPLGIELRADGLAALMLAASGLVGALVSANAIKTHASSSRVAGSFFALWFFTWSALNALFLSADIFNLYVTLELMTLAAVALIGFGRDRAALRAALRYLLVALPGSLIYLLGVAILYGIYATLDSNVLGARIDAGAATWTSLSLMTLGLGLKSALFPL